MDKKSGERIDLSVCLVNHNAKALTMDCLASIYSKTKEVAYEIILVDNNSADGSVEEIIKIYPNVNIIANRRNLGFAKANNQAINASIGKYIILLNNDTVLQNNALDKMVNLLEKNRDVGVVASKIVEIDGKTIIRTCRSFPSPFSAIFGRASLFTRIFPGNPWSNKNLLLDRDYDSMNDVDWTPCAAFMVRRDVIEDVGLLDESFFMYWEDTDWCKRIRRAGWRIVFFPEAVIIHHGGRGGGKRSLRLKLFTLYHMHRSAYYYFRKHYYKSIFHPMAILAFAGVVTLVGFKGAIEIGKSLFEKLKYSKND